MIVEEEKSDLQLQKINIAQLSLSLFEIVRMVKRGDIELNSDFHRKSKWKQDKKSRLIESIILDIPIQPIYFAEDEKYKFETIDGNQRIRTIYEYINNQFKLEGIKLLNINGYFDELESSIQRKIEDFKLVIFVVKKDNSPNVKFEIFERINI